MPLRVRLTQAKVSFTPWAKGVPTSLVAPERSIRWPIGMGCAAAGNASAAANPSVARLSFIMVSSRGSVRIGVEFPIGLDQPPAPREAVRLEDQEQDDRGAHR